MPSAPCRMFLFVSCRGVGNYLLCLLFMANILGGWECVSRSLGRRTCLANIVLFACCVRWAWARPAKVFQQLLCSGDVDRQCRSGTVHLCVRCSQRCTLHRWCAMPVPRTMFVCLYVCFVHPFEGWYAFCETGNLSPHSVTACT
jgi:hypothetical protein